MIALVIDVHGDVVLLPRLQHPDVVGGNGEA